MNEEYVFFWRGPFSQWQRASMTVNGITYNCCEQYMMYQKAILFGDTKTAEKILQATDPKEQKALGRLVNSFDEKKWVSVRESVVYDANYAKFTQHTDLLAKLLDTGYKTLVEASPFDKIWGIGLDAAAAKVTPPDRWPGLNLLGISLMRVRDDLRTQANEL